MPPPEVIDLAASSDVRVRDVYGRHQHQIITQSGENLLEKVYYHVSGTQANVSAVEVVSLDSSNNAQYDLLMRNSAAPLSLGDVTTTNVSTWSANSLVSVRRGTTAIRSANVTVGNLSTTSLNVAPGVSNRLDNFVVQSFQKTLVSSVGAATEICTITQAHGMYAAELDVIQSVTTGTNICRSFKFISWYNATANQWRRLVPLASTLNNATQWGVEIRVNNDVTTLRLVRLSGSIISGFECVLKLSQSRATPVAIAESTVTEAGGTVTFATTVHDTSLISQVQGNVGIGTDRPTHTLTVAGNELVTGNLNVTGNLSTTSISAASGTLSQTLSVTGNVQAGNLSTTSISAVSGTLSQTLSVTGDVQAGNLGTGLLAADRLAVTGNNHIFDATAVITVSRTISASTVNSGIVLGSIGTGSAGFASISGYNNIYVEVRVNQAKDANNSISKAYAIPFSGIFDTGGLKRLLPITSSYILPNDIGMEARSVDNPPIQNGHLELRLVRTKVDPETVDTTTPIQVSITVHYHKQSGWSYANGWIPSTLTYTSTLNPSASTDYFPGTTLMQTPYGLAVNTDNPLLNFALDVNGASYFRNSAVINGVLAVTENVTAERLAVTTANVSNLILGGTASGTGVTHSVADGSNALVTSNGVYKYVEATLSGSVELTNVDTGNVTANNMFMTTDGIARLDNYIVRSFLKSLGSTVGDTTDICTITGTIDGAYTAELHVVQTTVTASTTFARLYKFGVSYNATSGNWHRLLPLVNTHATSQLWVPEIRVSNQTTTLRLVRASGSVQGNITCTLTASQSRTHPITIADSTATLQGQTLSTTYYAGTSLTQVGGRVGINSQNPDYTLDVNGTARTTGMVVSGDVSGHRLSALTSISDSTLLQQGAHIAWNFSLGVGETNMINKSGSGSGGFYFYNTTGNGSSFNTNRSLLATITSGGIALSSGYFSAPGAIIGSLFATGKDSSINEGVTISPTSLNRSTYNSWTTVATFTYTPKSSDSRCSMNFDIYYLVNGSNGDTIISRITVDNTETFYRAQQFGTASGTGTRSTTIFPITGIFKNTSTSQKTIRIQLYVNDTDDTITLSNPNWTFELLERKT